jgi:hypothetical protein
MHKHGCRDLAASTNIRRTVVEDVGRWKVSQDICALHIQQRPIIRIYRIPGLDILSVATKTIDNVASRILSYETPSGC